MCEALHGESKRMNHKYISKFISKVENRNHILHTVSDCMVSWRNDKSTKLKLHVCVQQSVGSFTGHDACVTLVSSHQMNRFV